jgi:hypothetical protein
VEQLEYQYILSFERDRAYLSVGRLVERVRASGKFSDLPSGYEAEASRGRGRV